MSQRTVLLAEDDASIRLIVNQTLVTAGYSVRATSSPEALERWVRNGEGDVVVTDVYLTDTPIFELFALIQAGPTRPAGHCYERPKHDPDGRICGSARSI